MMLILDYMLDFERTISLTQLKRSPTKALKKIKGSIDPIYILSRGKPVGVLVDMGTYHKLEEAIEDLWAIRELEKIDLNEPTISLEEFVKEHEDVKLGESTLVAKGK